MADLLVSDGKPGKVRIESKEAVLNKVDKEFG